MTCPIGIGPAKRTAVFDNDMIHRHLVSTSMRSMLHSSFMCGTCLLSCCPTFQCRRAGRTSCQLSAALRLHVPERCTTFRHPNIHPPRARSSLSQTSSLAANRSQRVTNHALQYSVVEARRNPSCHCPILPIYSYTQLPHAATMHF
jgi:hypothetical protein